MRERAPVAKWVIVLFAVLMIVIVIDAILMSSAADPAWPIMILVVLVCAWAVLSFSSMSFEVTPEAVIARMWPFKRRLLRVDIAKVTVEPKVPWYAGIGWHYTAKTTWVTSRYGPYVRIEQKNGYYLALTPKDPEGFAKSLEKTKK
jgi:hypothetical protein